MKGLFFLGSLLCVWPALAQDYLIFDPPRSSQKFEWLLVVGTTIREERMFIYTNRYLVRGEDDRANIAGTLYDFSAFYVYLQGDFQIFMGGKDTVVLQRQHLSGDPDSFEKIMLLETGEVATVDFKPPVQFLFLKAKAPSPRFKKWTIGEESFYPPRVFFPKGDPATNMQPREAKVIMDRVRREE